MTTNRCFRQAQSCFLLKFATKLCRAPRPVVEPARLRPTLQRITLPVKKIFGQGSCALLLLSKITTVL